MKVLLVGAVALFALASAAIACGSRDPALLCEGATDCDVGQGCLVGRCRPATSAVVPPASRRVVLDATDVAVLSSRASEPVHLDVIALGRASLGEVVLLLRFDAELGPRVSVDSAFVVLDPVDRAPAPASPIDVSIAAIEVPWDSSSVSWTRKPTTGVAETVARNLPRGRAPLRIDVTDLMRRSGLANGVAIYAQGNDPIGALYSTGLGAGAAPRLELYLVAEGTDAAPPPSARPSASASASASASSAPSARPSASAKPSDPPKPKPKPPRL
ncbi:MAG: hypothetical protein U0414_37505 [Polyangiaceae bacterium]